MHFSDEEYSTKEILAFNGMTLHYSLLVKISPYYIIIIFNKYFACFYAFLYFEKHNQTNES